MSFKAVLKYKYKLIVSSQWIITFVIVGDLLREGWIDRWLIISDVSKVTETWMKLKNSDENFVKV